MLRQDPDDILIGEMRDLETVSAALTAAQTGHFVMSTLHTIDATETDQPDHRLLPAAPAEAGPHHDGRHAARHRLQRLLPRADGQGRVPAVEVMVMTNRIRDFVLEADQTHNIAQAIKEGEFYGMQTFDQALLKLYEEGLITLHDAAQVASNPHDFKLLVQSQGHDVSLMTF